MPATDVDAINRVVALYALQPGAVPTTAGFDHIIQVNPLAPFVGIKHNDGYDSVTARGSKTIEDFLRDAASEMPRIVPGFEALGRLPFGFSQDLPETYAAIKPLLRPGVPLAAEGHSLAGPEALHIAGAHKLSGGVIAAIGVYECPNPGTSILTQLLADEIIWNWWNHGDWVPTLPFPIPGLPWEPVRPATRFNIAPIAEDRFSLVPRHNVLLCQQAVIAAAGAAT